MRRLADLGLGPGGVGERLSRRPARRRASRPWSPSCSSERRMPAELARARDHRDQHHRGVRARPRRRPVDCASSGVQVSIDDFGAGFTSLAYLNSLAVGELKLDRRFIAPLAGGRRSRDSELVRATIDLGHALGLRVVAEGVEDGAALELLGELGCDVAQGYWRRPPGPGARDAQPVELAGQSRPLRRPRRHPATRPPAATPASRQPRPRSAATPRTRSDPRTAGSEQAAARRHHPRRRAMLLGRRGARARRPARRPACVIARASSDHARATPPTRAVGPQPWPPAARPRGR